jgi:hypothetical protein
MTTHFWCNSGLGHVCRRYDRSHEAMEIGWISALARMRQLRIRALVRDGDVRPFGTYTDFAEMSSFLCAKSDDGPIELCLKWRDADTGPRHHLALLTIESGERF